MRPTLGSLFAGIGGIDLGFERAGFETVWQVEINPYCRKVLARHFPNAERYEDVRTVGKHNLRPIDVIAGGFPCQDISNAGKRAGIDGERSGLWSEYARIIGELRPKFVLVENVAALLGRGMGRVLGDLAEIGYDAEWEIISAADVGAQHIRERVWILAHARCEGIYERGRNSDDLPESRLMARNVWNDIPGQLEVPSEILADAESERCREAREFRCVKSAQRFTSSREDVPNPNSTGLSIPWDSRGIGEAPSGVEAGPTLNRNSWWAIEPNVGRVANGVPSWVDRLRGLGNAVVPQIPELIANRIRECLEGAPADAQPREGHAHERRRVCEGTRGTVDCAPGLPCRRT